MNDRLLPALRPAPPAPALERGLGAPPATPPRRSRRRRASHTRATGARSRMVRSPGREGDPGHASDRRGVFGCRGRPRISPGHDRRAPPRSPPRTALRTTPTRATPAPSRRPVRDPPRARHRPMRSPAPLDSSPSRAWSSRSTRYARRRRDRALLLLGFAAALRRSELVALESRTRLRPARGLLVTIRASKTDQEQEGTEVAVPYARAGDNDARSARSRPTSRLPHPSRTGVPADAPRRHPHRPAALRPVRRADRQTRASGAGVPPACSPATRSGPGTPPRPRPPASRSARSPTSPATTTCPSCAATSAPRPRLTTSARCCRHEAALPCELH